MADGVCREVFPLPHHLENAVLMYHHILKPILKNVSIYNFKEHDLEWFPRMRAMSLAMDEGESEQNEMRNLQEKLESTTRLVYTLSQQLNELKEQVRCHLKYYESEV